MRIVAGEWGGRRIASPKGARTRPTADRVREALFSQLASHLGAGGFAGVSVLDAFAGTGALGLEALSRGAARATFVERDRNALAALRANIESVCAGAAARVVAGDATALARSGGLPGAPFGLLLLDPPYRIGAAAVTSVLGGLVAAGAICTGALACWEHAAGESAEWPDGFEALTHKAYGSTAVDIAVWRGQAEA